MVLLGFWQGKQMGFYNEVFGEQEGYLVACLSLTLASFGFHVFWLIYYAFVLHSALRVDYCCSSVVSAHGFWCWRTRTDLK